MKGSIDALDDFQRVFRSYSTTYQLSSNTAPHSSALSRPRRSAGSAYISYARFIVGGGIHAANIIRQNKQRVSSNHTESAQLHYTPLYFLHAPRSSRPMGMLISRPPKQACDTEHDMSSEPSRGEGTIIQAGNRGRVARTRPEPEMLRVQDPKFGARRYRRDGEKWGRRRSGLEV